MFVRHHNNAAGQGDGMVESWDAQHLSAMLCGMVAGCFRLCIWPLILYVETCKLTGCNSVQCLCLEKMLCILYGGIRQCDRQEGCIPCFAPACALVWHELS